MAELNDAPLFAPSEQPRADRPFFGGEEDRPLFTDAQKRVAPQPKELPLEQYKEMPWSNVLSRARDQPFGRNVCVKARLPSASCRS